MSDQERANARLRRGTPDDIEACHTLLWETVTDLGRRQATPLEGTADDWWQSGAPFQRFLAAHAAEWWVAEDIETGQLIGYARSIERGALFELTEFFVRPGHQSRGSPGSSIWVPPTSSSSSTISTSRWARCASA